jgi:hypothetical protein
MLWATARRSRPEECSKFRRKPPVLCPWFPFPGPSHGQSGLADAAIIFDSEEECAFSRATRLPTFSWISLSCLFSSIRCSAKQTRFGQPKRQKDSARSELAIDKRKLSSLIQVLWLSLSNMGQSVTIDSSSLVLLEESRASIFSMIVDVYKDLATSGIDLFCFCFRQTTGVARLKERWRTLCRDALDQLSPRHVFKCFGTVIHGFFQ